jgi:hypothetical protein
MSEVKYRHPEESSLEWSGKGRQPKWVEAYIEQGGTLESLELVNQHNREMEALDEMLDAAESSPVEIDLGIGESPRILGDLSTLDAQAGVVRLHDQLESAGLLAVAESGQKQLEVCLHEFGLIGLTAEEFVRAGVDDMNQATVRMCRAGVAFWAAQEALKTDSGRAESDISEATPDVRSRSFKDWIAESNLTEQRVYEAIGLAKFYARLPDAMRSKALTIGKSNALLLASLPKEVIDQAAESGNDLIGKADMMTVAELKEEIKALQRREKNYEAELERANSQVKRLSAAKKRTTDFLLRTEELREECMALQLGAELHLNSLRKLFEDTDPEAPEGKLQMEHLWIVANTLVARSLDLLEFMRARAPADMPSRIMTQHMLTPDEAIRWLQDYPLIENRFAAEAAVRESRREASRPRGPGRPAGAKNKGAEE